MNELINNIAGLDLYAVAHMSPDALRATLMEYRYEAIALKHGWTRQPNSTDWMSPCGMFIEGSARDACRIDNLA